MPHWNCFGQAEDEKGERQIHFSERGEIIFFYLGETESLTVFDVDGLKRCFKTSVHIGGIGEKHHAHRVGLAGFRHCSAGMFSAQSEDEMTQAVTRLQLV